MELEKIFGTALGIKEPIYIESVEFKNSELHIYLNFYKGTKFACPVCEKGKCAVHDTIEKTWRHLNFFQYQCYLHFALARIKCLKCGVHQYKPDWSRPESGFTALFEAFVIMLAKGGMPYSEMSRIVGEGDKRLRRIVDHYVEKAYKSKDLGTVTSVGIDETSSKKGHNYVTVVTDHSNGDVIYVTEGKDSETIRKFAEELPKHGGKSENITEITIDMSTAFIKGATETFPDAEITFDRFHVMKLLNEALDAVRRSEQKQNPLLKKSRYVWLKNRNNLSKSQLETLQNLENENLETAKAYQLKCTFQDIYANAKTADEAELLLDSWIDLAWNSGLEPMQDFADTLREHWYGIIRFWSSRLTSGICEGVNSVIQEIKRVARGYRNMSNFINTIYLRASKIKLPLSPFTHSI
jgi:transposase